MLLLLISDLVIGKTGLTDYEIRILGYFFLKVNQKFLYCRVYCPGKKEIFS